MSSISGAPGFVSIPVYRRKNKVDVVIAYTKVSVEDAVAVSEHRWYLQSGGYAWRQRPTKEALAMGVGRPVLLHRYIAERVMGEALAKRLEPDHINADKLDNRRENLEPVTRKTNMRRAVDRRMACKAVAV